MILEMIAAEQAIEQLIEDFTKSWNVHDAKSFASTFAEDADFTNVFGQKAHGRRAVENIHAAIFSTMFKESHLIAEEVVTRFMGEDLAAVDVRWCMSGARDRQGNPWPERNGLMNLVVRKEGRKWSILVMHNMDLPVITLN